jgi:hypothetical protein
MAYCCLVLFDQPFVDADGGSTARLAWGARKSRRIHQILRLFIDDISVSVSIDHDVINRA